MNYTNNHMTTPKIRRTEQIRLLYIIQADDHSAGDEHEIEYDIAAGV